MTRPAVKMSSGEINMRHRAFATYVALILLGLLGIVMTASVSLLKTDVQRTQQETSQVQLRELLISGQAMVADQIAASGLVSQPNLPLPAELSDATLTATTDSNAADTLRVILLAKQGHDDLQQILVYRKSDNHWKLTESTME